MNGKEKSSERERRDWVIILIILLFGFLCVIIAGEQAVRFAPNWKLETNMQSNLDPDSDFLTNRPVSFFEPLDPSILTLPAWVNIFLTPGATVEPRTPPPADTPVDTNTPVPTLFISPTPVKPTNTPVVIIATSTNTSPSFPPSTLTFTPKPPPTLTPLPSTVPVDLQVTKTDSVPYYIAGSSVTYTIVVTNGGSNTVIGATLSDPKPTQVTTWGWCIDPCTPAATGSANLSATLNLASGASVTYRVLANINAGAINDLVNTASVSVPAGYTDTVPGNNSATDTDALLTSADLSITKSDGLTNVNPGGTVTYTVRVANGGPGNVTGAILSDPFATGLTKTAVACSTTPGQCVTPPTSADLESGTFALPALSNGQFYEITISTTVTATGGNVTNTATVAAPTGINDPIPANDSASDTDAVNLLADLSITITDNSTEYVADVWKVYEIVVSNAGPSNVTGATVTNVFSNGNVNPATVIWVCTPIAVCTTPAGSGNLNEVVNLTSGSSVTFYVTAQAVSAPTGNLINTATVAAPSGITDPDTTNNSATDTDDLLVSSGTNYGNIGIGPGGDIELLPAGGPPIVLNLSSSITVNGSHAGPDLVYYEQNIGGIAMDWVILEVSDGSNWYTILNWGDGAGNPGTNIDLLLPVPPNTTDCAGEPDNCFIDVSLLYPYPVLPAYGVTIDLDALSPSIIPNGAVISYIRITVPPGGTDAGVGIDGIYVVP